MKRLVIVLLVICVFGSIRNSSRHGRIVGGLKAKLGQFPYQGELFLNSDRNHQCGACIISNKWVLTAGHCVDGLTAQDLTLRVGIIVLDNYGHTYSLKQIIQHPDYNFEAKQNDIALIETITPITFTDLVKSIGIANYELPERSVVVASGWGYTVWGSEVKKSNELYYLNLQTICNTDCFIRLLWFGKITNKQMCTLGKFAEGICGGDSGGPLVYKHKLVGIISWGIPCGANYPDVYTKVYAYLNWINGYIS